MTSSTLPFSVRTVLLVDAATCATMGVLLAVQSAPLGSLTQLPTDLLFYAGLALLPVAAFMAFVARGPRVHLGASWLVILGNVAWIVASLALLMSGWVAPNALGTVFIIAQALAVGVLTVLEIAAARAAPAVLHTA